MQLKINKAIRLSNKFHLRILHLDGPIVSWYRYETNQTKNTKKGSFDLRKCQNDQGIPKNFPKKTNSNLYSKRRKNQSTSAKKTTRSLKNGQRDAKFQMHQITAALNPPGGGSGHV